jgi:preprotein translocase subunit SecF
MWLMRTPNFNFVKYRRVAMAMSSLLSLLAFVALFYPGLNYGLDFTGGVLVEVGYPTQPDLGRIRSGLTDAGFESAQVQSSSSNVLIRLPPPDGEDAAELSPEAVTAFRRLSAGGGEARPACRLLPPPHRSEPGRAHAGGAGVEPV